MKRIRISGQDRFDNTNISCRNCAVPIIKEGVPVTPIYYADGNGHHYCPKCKVDEKVNEKMETKLHKKIVLAPFTESDWFAYAGAEGLEPKIGYLETKPNGDGGYCVVADATGVCVSEYIQDEDSNEFYLPCNNQAIATALASTFALANIQELLVAYGFQNIT